MSSTFSYFDQFSDITVNLNPYLTNISQRSNIDYTFSNIQPIQTTLKNMFNRIELINNFKKNILFFDSYLINDGERPENLSYKIYGDVNYWWLFCIFNNIRNIWLDWPMTEEQLNDLANKLYNEDNKYTRTTYYNLLHERNELKRQILILKPFYINDVITSFRNMI